MFRCEMGVLAGEKHAISERLFSLVRMEELHSFC